MAQVVADGDKRLEGGQPGSPEYLAASQDRDRGLNALKQISDQNAANPAAQFELANAYMRLSRYDDAYKAATRAAKVQPNNPDAWYLLAASAHGLGRSGDSEKLARKALTLNSRHEGAFAILKLAEGRGNNEVRPSPQAPGGGKMSRPDVNFHQKGGPAPAPGSGKAGIAKAAANSPSQLPAELTKPGVKLTSSDELKADVLTEQARAKVGLDPAAAVALLDQAIALNPKSADAYSERARAKLAAGAPKSEIEADLMMAAKLDPNFSLSYEDLIVSVGLVPGGEDPGKPAPAPLRDKPSSTWGWMSLWRERGTNPGLVAVAAGLGLIALCLAIYFVRKLINKAEVVPHQE